MSTDFEKYARNIADSSGFPLQIRIADIVTNHPKWQIFLEEHPWSIEGNLKGFSDIIINHNYYEAITMVIECKRVKQAQWVFLLPKLNPSLRSHACLLYLWHDTGLKSYKWRDWQADPTTYESQFCAIPGQEQGRRNLLERTTAELIEAIDALAWQEYQIKKKQEAAFVPLNRLYIPVIVTTAELIISSFDPETISLKDGSLPPDANFQKVPFVRFRKSLTNKPQSPISPPLPNSSQEAHLTTERTVFIVNAEGFKSFLDQFEIRE
jgi:hypothetical protein